MGGHSPYHTTILSILFYIFHHLFHLYLHFSRTYRFFFPPPHTLSRPFLFILRLNTLSSLILYIPILCNQHAWKLYILKKAWNKGLLVHDRLQSVNLNLNKCYITQSSIGIIIEHLLALHFLIFPCCYVVKLVLLRTVLKTYYMSPLSYTSHLSCSLNIWILHRPFYCYCKPGAIGTLLIN